MNPAQSEHPVAAFRKPIVASVRVNPVTILVAEPGAGKSSQIPLYLLNEGYRVLTSQPRCLAARTVSSFAAGVRGEKLGDVVGFRTAYENVTSVNTSCLYATDGLVLMLELMKSGNYNVLIIK